MAPSAHCPDCHAPLDSAAKFCGECGTDLPRTGTTTRLRDPRKRTVPRSIVFRALVAIALVGLGWLLGTRANGTPLAVTQGEQTVHVESKFEDRGLSLSAVGALAGLEAQDAEVVLLATGIPDTICTNPGGQQPAGQNKRNKGWLTLTGSKTISAGEIKNGNATFDLKTAVEQTAKALGCPNKKWTGAITDVSFTSATITVSQHGKVVLQKEFPQ